MELVWRWSSVFAFLGTTHGATFVTPSLKRSAKLLGQANRLYRGANMGCLAEGRGHNGEPRADEHPRAKSDARPVIRPAKRHH